jgi:hypothetical protein
MTRSETGLSVLQFGLLLAVVLAWRHEILARLGSTGRHVSWEAFQEESWQFFLTPWVLSGYFVIMTACFWRAMGPRRTDYDRNQRKWLIAALVVSTAVVILRLLPLR